MKLDGSEIAFTAAPIPRAVKVKYIPENPVTSPAQQQALEAAITLQDGAGTTVAGTYAWAADGSSLLFTPTARLAYRTTYTVHQDGTPVRDASFTTLTKDDINGDGFADLIVGALWAGQMTRDGRFYILYGTAAGMPTCDLSGTCTPGAKLSGALHDYMGISNDIVGDVNGDGYEDFIVGAPQTSGTREGTAYVFAGGTGLTGTLNVSQAHATITATAGGVLDDLGYSVAGAGDMNGDGYDDVVIGAPMIGDDGKAYVFLGGTTLTGTLDVAAAAQTVTGSGTEFMAAMVDGAGDVNADGYDDIILSSASGHAYVFYGAPTLATARAAAAADARLIGTNEFGKSVAGVGDVDGDGKADVLVGDPTPGAVPRSAYVFLGGQLTGDVAAGAASSTITVPNGNDDLFARTLTGAGDVDNDGRDDLLIGGFTASPGADRGQAYLFLGSQLPANLTDADANAKFTGATGGDNLSLGLKGAVDFNNDGFDDIVLGAPQYGLISPGKGFAYVFNGSAASIATCDLSTTPTCPTAKITGATKDALGFMGTTKYPLP